MTACQWMCLFGLSLVGAQQELDAFRYADTAAARQAWTATSGTPAVALADEGGRSVLEVRAPFALQPELERTILDRRVKLDLSAPGSFALEVSIDVPTAVTQVTLYFRSGGGWYASGRSLAQTGWQTLRFSKASFRVEDRPTGWHAIDGIRISAWRGKAQDAVLRIRRLASLTHEVAMVVPAESGRRSGETKTALDTARHVGEMLSELGLEADVIEEPALVHGALGGRQVAILAYNPGLDDEAQAALEKFVAGGGKLLVCYLVPARLARLLGVQAPQYVPQVRPGHFAEMRFETDALAGLPAAVRQASWNITSVEPAADGVRIVGRWYDDAGQPSGQPALVVGPHGAFLSHILLPDDRQAKKQLLAALLGHFSPSFWQTMAQSALDRTGRIGHLETIDELVAYVRAQGSADTRQRLDAATQVRAAARKALDARQFPQAIEQARRSHELLAETYARAQPSRAKEGRAVWNHSGTGAYPGDWERSAKELADAGFNMIVPNMLWAGVAYYPSDILPRGEVVEKYGDQIAQCLAAAHRHGLEVHVWKVNFNLSNAPRDFVEKLRGQKRLIVSSQGKTHDWLCPSHPENFKLELDSILEVARKYEVNGLHFDYIRYPGSEYCYCDGCRQRFESQSGRPVAEWPRDCVSGDRRDEYQDWRCQQITKLVAAVHREAKQIRPGLKISAAVFGSYPDCRRSVGQDWVAWVQAGYLDFVCPMDYTGSHPAFCSLVENQIKLVEGRIPIYPGIGASASKPALTPDGVVAQVFHARRLGAGGFTIFEFGTGTSQGLIRMIGLGVGSQPAVPPHR